MRICERKRVRGTRVDNLKYGVLIEWHHSLAYFTGCPFEAVHSLTSRYNRFFVFPIAL